MTILDEPANVDGSLDVLVRESLWDLDVARRVTTDLPDLLFTAPPRNAAWAALTALVQQGVPALDPPMVMRKVTTDRMPGWEHTCRYLTGLSLGGYGAGTIGWHLNVAREQVARMQLVQLALRTQQAADGNVDDALHLARTGLERIDTRATEAPPTVADLLMPHLERLETKDTSRVLPTGLHDLDDRLAGGFRPGQLVIVGAQTGAGKSLMLGGFARHAAIREQATVVFSSLEMSRAELMDRFLAAESGVSLRALNARDLSEDDWARLSRHLDALGTGRLHVDETPVRTVADITAVCRPLHPALVCVDYLQLLRPSGKASNRQEEVAALSRGLKLMARGLDCTVVAAAQLNREADKRQDKTPRKSDLRESGALEQDADLILLLDRDENDDTLGTDASLIVAKQRSGPLGTVPLVFSGDHARFHSAYRP